MKKYFFFFFILFNTHVSSYENFHAKPTYNSLGQTGLIYVPSAEINKEKSIYFTFNRNEIWKLGTITATPFNWLEASYFYYRPNDLLWGGGEGLYLDKGFNVKFSYQPKYRNLPAIAIGLDDFAGTGQFTREFIATTLNTKNTKFSLGIGWGKYAGNSSFENPLNFISEKANIRPTGFSNLGGSPEYRKWFRGEASLFGGIEWSIPKTNGMKLKLELDPYDYNKFSCCGEGRGPRTSELRTKDSDLNFGLSIPIKNWGSTEISFIKGNTFSLSFSIGVSSTSNRIKRENFKPKIEKTNFNVSKKDLFYRDLLHNLSINNIYLQTADYDNNNVSVTIDSPELRNQIQSSSRAAIIVEEVSKIHDYHLNYIDVGHILRGIEINNIEYMANDIEKSKIYIPELLKRNATIQSVKPYDFINDEFRPRVKFPVIFNSINPDIRTHVGSPERFLYKGIGFTLENEMQISRSLSITTSLGINIDDNFDDKISDPNSVVRHVRTEVLNYLQESDVYLKRLQFEYIWSPFQNIYSKLSGGILEEMYGGYGLELMYKPFNKNFMIGYENYHLKRRTYEQRFDFFHKEGDIHTDHINFSYMMVKPQIFIKYSFGNYLAGDKGYTLDLSRYSNEGLRVGFYFTRTDMSFREFGEGSFDKGFYFSIPNDVLFRSFSKGNIGFHLKTMTRDGGQKLRIHNRLDELLFNTNKHEVGLGWYGLFK